MRDRFGLYARHTFLWSGVWGFLAWCLWPSVLVFVGVWMAAWAGGIAANLLADDLHFPDDSPERGIVGVDLSGSYGYAAFARVIDFPPARCDNLAEGEPMIFELNGHKYRVSFGHELYATPVALPTHVPEHSPYHGRTNMIRATSTCFIVELLPEAGSKPRPVARGVTHCSITENFDKATGREFAFWRALKSVSPHPNKFWEMAIKAYAHSGAHRPPKAVQKLAQSEPVEKAQIAA